MRTHHHKAAQQRRVAKNIQLVLHPRLDLVWIGGVCGWLAHGCDGADRCLFERRHSVSMRGNATRRTLAARLSSVVRRGTVGVIPCVGVVGDGAVG